MTTPPLPAVGREHAQPPTDRALWYLGPSNSQPQIILSYPEDTRCNCLTEECLVLASRG